MKLFCSRVGPDKDPVVGPVMAAVTAMAITLVCHRKVIYSKVLHYVSVHEQIS